MLRGPGTGKDNGDVLDTKSNTDKSVATTNRLDGSWRGWVGPYILTYGRCLDVIMTISK